MESSEPAQVGTADAEPARGEPPRSLPRGRHKLDAGVVAASQRARLVEAIVEACAQKGYAAVTVADVVGRAGVSRKTFYEQFENKEDCFLAAYDDGVAWLQREIAAAVSAGRSWQERLRAACETYIESLASCPAFARFFLVEAVAAGGRIHERRDAAFDVFIELYRELHSQARKQWPQIPPVERDILVALIGSIAELSRTTVNSGGPDALRDITDTLVKISWTFLRGLESPPGVADRPPV